LLHKERPYFFKKPILIKLADFGCGGKNPIFLEGMAKIEKVLSKKEFSTLHLSLEEK